MEIFLTNVTANFSGKTRRETLNGREYVVCNVVMIVPGVLAGSRGPLLYPEEEVSHNIEAWNGMPLTARHPTINGEPVSARRPDVANKYVLGYVYAANYDGRLTAEAWFDVELTRRIDNRIIQYLESGKKIEVSTGLFTQNSPAPAGAVHNGTPYTHIARNYRPDHLAVLMDETGACSIKDGCGLNVNQSPSSLENTVNKDQLISWLTTNCSCWKGPNASAALNAMTDQELQQLKTTAENNANTNKQLQTITNALSAGFVVNGAKVTLDPTTGQFKAEQIQNSNPAPTPQVIEIKPVGQPTDNRSETFLQLLERTGSVQEKEVWNTAVAMFNSEKAQIVERLTANLTDATAKANAVAVYNSMDISALRKIAPPAPVANTNPNPNATFDLGAGGPVVNLNKVGGRGMTVTKIDNTTQNVGLPVARLTFDNPLTKK